MLQISTGKVEKCRDPDVFLPLSSKQIALNYSDSSVCWRPHPCLSLILYLLPFSPP